jgi:hypothetical protein
VDLDLRTSSSVDPAGLSKLRSANAIAPSRDPRAEFFLRIQSLDAFRLLDRDLMVEDEIGLWQDWVWNMVEKAVAC